MRLAKKAYVISAAVVISAGLGFGISGVANASSRIPIPSGGGASNCANGIYSNYCGTQESATDLYIAVGWGDRIIGRSYPQPWNAEFIWFADASSSAANNDKYAVFAPNGVASNKVMAEVNHHIILATASGASDQKWVFDGTGWQNVATGDVLQSTFNGGPILAVTGPSSGSSESWTFVIP
jgi:hypothetical protein